MLFCVITVVALSLHAVCVEHFLESVKAVNQRASGQLLKISGHFSKLRSLLASVPSSSPHSHPRHPTFCSLPNFHATRMR